MQIFIKKLQSQESGYSGDKPDQRGKYILIPNWAWKFFPHLLESTLNDFKILNLHVTNTDENIGLNYVYHNAKFHPDKLKRNHNERRVYRTGILDRQLDLDRSVIIIVAKDHNMALYISSIHPKNDEYNEFEKLSEANRIHSLSEVLHLKKSRDIVSSRTRDSSPGIVNFEEIAKDSLKRSSTQREQGQNLPGDPAAMLLTLIKNQDDFKNYLREIYGGSCALRKEKLVDGSFLGLEAAHIMPHSQGGPLLPTNGILMSSDLHQSFEKGAFTLSEKNEVIINSLIPKTSKLHEFNGTIIKPEPLYQQWAPYNSYVENHRKTQFDTYQP